ncbi:MAG: NUDIX hydrolase [Nanoarchaeota archaeon]
MNCYSGVLDITPLSSPVENMKDWEEAKNRRKGGTFYDGDLVAVDMALWEVNDYSLSVLGQRIKYSQHAGLYRKNPDAPFQAIYVNGIMITKDERIVLGKTQATEANWLGNLSLPAGGVKVPNKGAPSLPLEAMREMDEETGIFEYSHLPEVIVGWINSKSEREGNYHLTQSYVCPLTISSSEMRDCFRDWKSDKEKEGKQSEFSDLRFIPNNYKYLNSCIDKQDNHKNPVYSGKSLDVLEAWSRAYNCDLMKLIQSKDQPRIYLSQMNVK